MKTSSLEITEQEYLIKLNKNEFDLSFIHQIIKRIQSEQFFFSKKEVDHEDDFSIRSKDMDNNLYRFDRLCDK
ncbi:MAG: hypothetical protein JWN56_109 [Sphingobacteriales bacterium]|nr:hypothetical protein [Sphingobacteriales bacterium]